MTDEKLAKPSPWQVEAEAYFEMPWHQIVECVSTHAEKVKGLKEIQRLNMCIAKEMKLLGYFKASR